VKRILITGVSGFLGGSLVKHFNEVNDFLLFGTSREPEKARQILKPYTVEMLKDSSATTLDEFKIDCVIHLAGIAHDLSGRFRPDDYYRVNFENTRWVYDEFLRSAATGFVFLSSIKAAADSSTTPIDESVYPQPVTDYGKSKLKAEEHIVNSVLPGEKQFYIVRPCMIHGPGNKGNLNLLYRFVKSGFPYPLGNFQNQRSFLSVDNFTFIIQKVIENCLPSGIYHLADNGFMSANNLYVLIAGILGKKRRILNIPKGIVRLGAWSVGRRQTLNKLTESMMVSNEKIVKILNCMLPVELEDGLVKTIRSLGE
jgi:nucleoside-diphosphate-sugar epimerase